MSPESQLARQESPISQQEFSIFDFYSIEREVEFIHGMEGLPEEDKRFYLRENINRFLGEFVGKVPYTKISLLLKPDGLHYAGFKPSHSYEKASNQREMDELRGYRQVEEQLLKGTPGIAWINPPKEWDYSFVYFFWKDSYSERVDEYALRYKEPRNTVAESQILLHSLFPNLDFLNSSTFLRNPLTSSQPEFDLNTLMSALGIGFEEIKKSELFEKRIEKRLSTSIDAYITAVLEGDHEAAARYLTGLYNAAQEIKNELDKDPLEKSEVLILFEKPLSYDQFMAFSRQKATVLGGGSCPVTRPGNSTPLSGFNLMDNLKLGLTIEDVLRKNTCPECSSSSESHFHCPGCGGSIPSGKGVETCPHCNLNKDDYAKKTGIMC